MINFSKTIQHWYAEIFLRYEVRNEKTRLVSRKQEGPLMVQRPFYPEKGISHTYLLHPPGGVVGGDYLGVDIEVAEKAHSLITTPGATKFYRSSGIQAKQIQTLKVEAGGFLEWLPQENIFFPDTNALVETNIRLAKDSKYIGWEMNCFGRPAINEVFYSGLVKGRTNIYVEDKLVLSEALFVESCQIQSNVAGLRGFPMMGSIYISPASESLHETIRNHLELFVKRCHEPLEYGLTEVDGIIAVRVLGHQAEIIMGCFIAVWTSVRMHWIGKVPQPPRIWAT